MTLKTYSLELPKCEYPKASDLDQHGLLELPDSLSKIDFSAIEKYRNYNFKPIGLDQLDNLQIIKMAKMMAKSFITHEPIARHIKPPLKQPTYISGIIHKDEIGMDVFGEWSSENIMFWFIRIFILTNPFDLLDTISINKKMLELSFAIIDDNNTIVGGVYNLTAPTIDKPIRKSDVFINAISLYMNPIFEVLNSQEDQAIETLRNTYPDFKIAHDNGKVGLPSMTAKSSKIPKEDIFELFVLTTEKYLKLGYEYLIVSASNQWSGAVCEALKATRVHFLPYRNIKRVAVQRKATEIETYSSDGFISDKDSGILFYVIKLK